MLKQLFILMILFIAITSCNPSFDKKASRKLFNNSHKMFIETEYFGIRTKPITNREYLICLAWHIWVYNESYPQYVEKLLPIDYDKQFEYGWYEGILTMCKGTLRDYILNPKYIDYPVTNLTEKQVGIIQKWMNDRYNEDLLIRTGFADFNDAQKDEDCYTFESYAVNQYLGSIKTPASTFKKHNYKSTFRLPYQNELKILNNQNDTNLFKPYPMTTNDFLWRWNESFLSLNLEQNVWMLNFGSYSVKTTYNEKIEFNPKTGKCLFLTDKSKEFQNTKYLQTSFDNNFSKYPYPEKNQYGQMEFIFVGVDKDNRPIVADKMKLEETVIENGIYWIAYNRLLEDEYLPK